MAYADLYRQRAQQKSNYVDRGGAPTPIASARPAFNPRPQLQSPQLGQVRPPGGTPSLTVEQILSAPKRPSTTPSGSGGSFLDDLGGIAKAAGRGIMGVLDVADMSRRAYQGIAGEVGDLVESLPGNINVIEGLANSLLGNPFQLRGLQDEDGGFDTSFDFGDIRRSVTGDDAMGTGFSDRSPWMKDLPGVPKAIVGFAGDILADPLTYLTAGTVKAGQVGAKGGVAAARTVLAKDLAQTFAAKEGKQVIEKTAQDALIKAAGKRGRGALTSKSLKKVGVSADDLAQYGIKTDFGYSVGVGKKLRTNIAGTRRLAEASENLKGSVKAISGAGRPSKIAGDLLKSNDLSARQLERELLSGGENAADAARMLVLVTMGKGESRDWVTRSLQRAETIPGFGELDEGSRRALTHALEMGDYNHPLVKELDDYFAELGQSIKERGGQIKFWKGRDGERYVPHRLSAEARKALDTGDQAVGDIWDDAAGGSAPTAKAEQIFQKARETDSTIDEINARWRADGHDYDLLEDDIHKLVQSYLVEGQEAVMRGTVTGEQARKFGFVDDMDVGINESKADQALGKLVDEEKRLLERAGKRRRASLDKAKKEARAERSVAKQRVTKLQKMVSDTEVKAKQATVDRQLAEDRLKNAQIGLDYTKAAMRKAHGQRKAALTLQVKKNEAAVQKALDNVASADRQLATAEKDFGRYANDLAEAEKAHEITDQAYQEAVAARQAADLDPTTRPEFQELDDVQAAAEAEVKYARAIEDVSAAKGMENVAVNTAGWVRAGGTQAADRLTRQIDRLDTVLSKKMLKRGRTTPDKMAYLADLRERTATIRDLLRNPDARKWNAIDKLEAQAYDAEIEAFLAAERMDALKAGRQSIRNAGDEFDIGVKLLKDHDFQDLLELQTRDGWSVLKQAEGDDLQINDQFDAAMRKLDVLSDPKTRDEAWQAVGDAFGAYKKSLNWWKGWAVSSPGFLFRNLYSGMFNMYLDDVSPDMARRFFKFYHATEGMTDEEAFAKGMLMFKQDRVKVENMIQARKASAATGSGQTVTEFEELFGGKTKWNPLSANNKVVAKFRGLGEDVEAALRGGHAYGIIERGGSFNEAVQRVEKFQFNYQDIGKFDRAAKNIMPFWTFWSRNLGLQAQVFAKKPQKVTRSYYNAKRNIEGMGGTDFGETVPGYITGSMAGIATNIGKIPGMPSGQAFLTPDFPSARFPAQLTELLSDPVSEIGSSTAPWLKAPAQLFANKDLFTGREYRNSLTTFDDTGEVGRKAPSVMQIPGVDRLLGMLPGAEYADGDLYMQDNVEAALMQANPVLGRVAGFLPNTARGQEQFGQKVMSFVGGPIRVNDEGSIAGAEYGLRKDQEARMRAIEEKLKFNRIVGG